MAMLASRPSAAVAAEEVALIQQILQDYRETVSELALRISVCETKYGIPSSEVHQAIDDGRLEENSEVCSWLIDIDRMSSLVRD